MITDLRRTLPVTLVAGALVAMMVSGCGSDVTPSAPPLSVVPVTSAAPAFADHSGGTLGPAGHTTFPLTAGAVQALLAKDGASAAWVADSPTLVVQSGLYDGVPAGTPGSEPSTSTGGVASYVFSHDTGPCPPSSGGGAGTPASGSTPPTTCTGTVVANAATGAVIDVEVRPA